MALNNEGRDHGNRKQDSVDGLIVRPEGSRGKGVRL